jgi:hypothetical protein
LLSQPRAMTSIIDFPFWEIVWEISPRLAL